MPSPIQQKVQLLKNLFSSFGDRYVFHIDESGERRWFTILGVLCVAFLIALPLHYRLFTRVQSIEEIAVPEGENSVERIDQRALDQVIKAYRERKREFEKALTLPPSVVDPSR